MKKYLVLAATFSLSQFALAETITYDVKGMHCGSCAKSISAQVCKMDGLESCEVSVGKVVISPKTGFTFSQDQIQAAISKAGEYKIIGTSTSK